MFATVNPTTSSSCMIEADFLQTNTVGHKLNECIVFEMEGPAEA